jgi:hypothetical protein
MQITKTKCRPFLLRRIVTVDTFFCVMNGIMSNLSEVPVSLKYSFVLMASSRTESNVIVETNNSSQIIGLACLDINRS